MRNIDAFMEDLKHLCRGYGVKLVYAGCGTHAITLEPLDTDDDKPFSDFRVTTQAEYDAAEAADAAKLVGRCFVCGLPRAECRAIREAKSNPTFVE